MKTTFNPKSAVFQDVEQQTRIPVKNKPDALEAQILRVLKNKPGTSSTKPLNNNKTISLVQTPVTIRKVEKGEVEVSFEVDNDEIEDGMNLVLQRGFMEGVRDALRHQKRL